MNPRSRTEKGDLRKKERPFLESGGHRLSKNGFILLKTHRSWLANDGGDFRTTIDTVANSSNFGEKREFLKEREKVEKKRKRKLKKKIRLFIA